MNEAQPESVAELQGIAALINDAMAWRKHRDRFCATLAAAGEELAAAGYPGMLDICLVLSECLQGWGGEGTDVDDTDLAVLASLPDAFMAHVQAPGDAGGRDMVMTLLRYPSWGGVIDDGTAGMFAELLAMHDAAGSAAGAAGSELDDAAFQETAGSDESASIPDTVSDDLPPQLRELALVMLQEVAGMRLAAQDARRGSGRDTAGEPSAKVDTLLKGLAFFAEASASVDLAALGRAAALAHQGLCSMLADGEAGPPAVLDLLLRWLEAVRDYLRNPLDAATGEALLACMGETAWGETVSTAELESLRGLLAEPPAAAVEATAGPSRPPVTAADVSLALPDDVDRDLLDAMLHELPGQTEVLTATLQRLAAGGTQEDVLLAKRIAHTLKGAGNTVGVRGIACLTHRLEEVLLLLNRNDMLPPPAIVQVMMNAADCLSVMSDALIGLSQPPGDALQVLQQVVDVLDTADAKGIDGLRDMPSRTISHLPAEAVPEPPARSQPETEPAAVLRVQADFVDQLLRLAGESKIMTSQVQNLVAETLAQVKTMWNCFDHLRQIGSKVEELSDIKNLNVTRSDPENDGRDALEMEHYSELYTYSKWLAEATVDAREVSLQINSNVAKLRETLVVQSRLNDETSEFVARARRVPAEIHFQRLQRCVRQACKLTGKDVRLHIEGGATLLDAETLNALLDPLMHVLRNAVDHGIEPEDARLAGGKPAHGNIYLSFSLDGDNVVILCRDDGRGLDLEAIRAKAIGLGLLAPDSEVSAQDLVQFILRPDFTTRSEATQVSGRGIGMDAVYAAVTGMSGNLAVESRPGQGCTVNMRLPVSSLSMVALLVRVGPQLMVLAARSLQRVLHHEQFRVQPRDGRPVVVVDDSEFPAWPVERLLGLAGDRRSADRLPRTAVLYQLESGSSVILVEKVIASGDFVVKRLGEYVPALPGILGVTILGDGTVAPVVDVAELLRQPRPDAAAGRRGARTSQRTQLPVALVVDDSLSARRSLSQFMQDAGYEVRQARDGIEAMEIINAGRPDLLLSDLEMPRMNGLELAGHVRANAETADLPIIMVTSRATARQEREAIEKGIDVYLNKPFPEDRLIEEIQRLQGRSRAQVRP